MGLYAPYRISRDADHWLPDLRQHFYESLAALESLPGWVTARLAPPRAILGSLDGLEISFLAPSRLAPGVTLDVRIQALPEGLSVRAASQSELLRIKSYQLMVRNMARDYADCWALSSLLPEPQLYTTLTPLEENYELPDWSGWSHDGKSRPLCFLEEMGLRLLQPAPRDTRKIRLHWEHRFQLQNPQDLSNWEALVPRCQILGRKVLDVHRLRLNPRGEPALASCYGVSPST